MIWKKVHSAYFAFSNEINNIRFVCDDASNFMVKKAKAKEKIDIVIMDPPRSGSDENFIKSVDTTQNK